MEQNSLKYTPIMKKILVTLLFIGAIVFVAIWFYQSHIDDRPNVIAVTQQTMEQSKSQTATTTPSVEPTKATSSPTPTIKIVKTYTMADVAAHGADPNSDECWTVIHGRVYNIKGFLDKHPGGESIYEACGADATKLFETRPNGSNTPHSVKARAILETYYIGDLQK